MTHCFCALDSFLTVESLIGETCCYAAAHSIVKRLCVCSKRKQASTYATTKASTTTTTTKYILYTYNS